MEKVYITANELLHDSFSLAKKVYESDFKPNFIIGVWRGGAPVGIAIQEYLDFVGVQTDHIAIRTSSYIGIGEQEKTVRVHGLDYIVDNINADDRVLLVDDVFDSGRSIQAILERLRKKTRRNMPDMIKIACPWYKPNRNITEIEPDFYVRETDSWLVFPHELNGLSLLEIEEHKPHLANTLPDDIAKRKKT